MPPVDNGQSSRTHSAEAQMKRTMGAIVAAAGLFAMAVPASTQTALRVANPPPSRHAPFARIVEPRAEQVRKAANGRALMPAIATPPGPSSAPAVEPGGEMFIGTGDGSNGFWVRP